jgi:hypothetical protein
VPCGRRAPSGRPRPAGRRVERGGRPRGDAFDPTHGTPAPTSTSEPGCGVLDRADLSLPSARFLLGTTGVAMIVVAAILREGVPVVMLGSFVIMFPFVSLFACLVAFVLDLL